jgi:hypothetical protein
MSCIDQTAHRDVARFQACLTLASRLSQPCIGRAARVSVQGMFWDNRAETILRFHRFSQRTEHRYWMIDPHAKLVEALDHAQEYLDLAIKAQDRGEREFYERICDYMRIAQEFEALIDE